MLNFDYGATAEVDLFEEEKEEDNQIVEIPKQLRSLRTQAYDKSVSDLMNMIDKGYIVFNPEYQRKYVWDNKKASLLVESILLNIPIPVIYASEDDDGNWNIVDGLQRLNSLKRYYDGKFNLKGLEVFNELNNDKYSDLNVKARKFLDNANLRVVLLFNDSHPEIKYDIFMRLNTGSVKLKEQELRNCLYRGELNELIKEIVNEEIVLNIFKLKEPHKRMDDAEIVLRYIAISENYNRDNGVIRDYAGVMKTFLNKFMGNNKNLSKYEKEELKSKCYDTFEKVYEIFGSNAFRKCVDGDFSGPINRSLMDVITISFEEYSLENLKEKKQEIVNLYVELPQVNTKFDDSITFATSSTDVLMNRLAIWREELRRVMES